ncbi:3-oxoadipate enol-lactonase [Amycolatopsis anabasis]|uniref:3-oxoadipate enol-lactonase n=1 Tax=Amycolatopsis anabasis TaxID=1840409 RepID=UPI001FE851CB|nr:3-oxoadipate enol-lactonase [Amycolatopsis anabasis]
MSVALHHVVDGPAGGEVVVLSNSVGSDLRMWDPQVGPLTAAGFRVVRYDQRGHGKSPVPPGPCTIGDLGDDVLALLDSLGAERVRFAGLSLGGMTGMWLAARHPDRISRLVLCCTSARLGPAKMWADRAALVRAEGTGVVAEAGVGRWLTPGFRERNPGRAGELRDMIAATPAEGYASCCGAIERMDLTGELASITAPTLVIAGAEDPATPPEHGRRIADGIPGARLEIVEGAAHLGNVEQPARFSELIIEHFQGAA